jgi:hypothetical protein
MVSHQQRRRTPRSSRRFHWRRTLWPPRFASPEERHSRRARERRFTESTRDVRAALTPATPCLHLSVPEARARAARRHPCFVIPMSQPVGVPEQRASADAARTRRSHAETASIACPRSARDSTEGGGPPERARPSDARSAADERRHRPTTALIASSRTGGTVRVGGGRGAGRRLTRAAHLAHAHRLPTLR